MTLSEWQTRGWLRAHQTSPREIADLIALADRDLTACQTPGLDADSRLSIAHNAALQLATAALAASGYRAERDAYHARVLASLALTIGAEPGLIRRLDSFRRKRNQTAYELAGLASVAEADEMVALAIDLRRLVVDWLAESRPDLAP